MSIIKDNLANIFKIFYLDCLLPSIGTEGAGSRSQGKKIHVSCDTSVINVSTTGLQAV